MLNIMLNKDTQIFVSYHPDDKGVVSAACEKIRATGWGNIVEADGGDTPTISDRIAASGMFIVFLSKSFAQDDRLMLEEFADATVFLRLPFLPVWLDDLKDIQADYASALSKLENDPYIEKRQLLSALEMLVAKHPGTTAEGLACALTDFKYDEPEYTPSKPQICQAPCEAYEGDAPYIFISYAHDDAERVYPIVKNLFEEGWDAWYDEGIRPTQRYLPVIADHIKRSSVFVLMLSKRCLQRPFVMNYELALAQKLRIPIITVRLKDDIQPPDYAKDLLKTAIQENDLLERIKTCNLPNHGSRTAIPPAVKQNVIYDIHQPPKIPGFETGAYEGGIAITKYVGEATHVDIPATAKTPDGTEFKIAHIGYHAFDGCKSLASITLPESLTSIGEGAFEWCESLASITLPESLTSIGERAFLGCRSLTIYCPRDSVAWRYAKKHGIRHEALPES